MMARVPKGRRTRGPLDRSSHVLPADLNEWSREAILTLAAIHVLADQGGDAAAQRRLVMSARLNEGEAERLYADIDARERKRLSG